MGKKQLLKKIEKAIELLKLGKVKTAYDVLREVRDRLLEEEQPKEEGKIIQHLIGWYLNLWEQRPPEALRYMRYKDIIGKHLRELISIYKRLGEDIETLKRDYENFKASRKEKNGILEFRANLPSLKKNLKEWCSPENQRGKDLYLKYWTDEQKNSLWRDEDEAPWV